MKHDLLRMVVILVLLIWAEWASAMENDRCSFVVTGIRDSLSLIKLKTQMEQMEEKCSDVAEFHYQFGYILERLLKYDEALVEYQKAIAQDKKTAKYYGRAAGVMANQKEVGEAIRYLGLALELEPENKEFISKLKRLQK